MKYLKDRPTSHTPLETDYPQTHRPFVNDEAMNMEAKSLKKNQIMWRIIKAGLITLVIVVVVVVAVVVTSNKQKTTKSDADSQNPSSYAVSPYANLTRMSSAVGTLSVENSGRILVVGDVHGCLNELNQLIAQLRLTSEDRLILAGDLTSKGPDSVGVLRRAKEIGALCVRGNHDDKVVRLKTFQLQKGDNAMQPLNVVMPEGNVGDPLKFGNYHRAVASNMTQDDYNYLDSCPMALTLPSFNNSVVVHAGMDPAIQDINSQIPYLVMNMRDINNGIPVVEKKIGDPWANVWNAAQETSAQPMTVFYGHAASRGVQVTKYAVGVDSGCVYGGLLTAIDIKTRVLTQVNCNKYISSDDD
ncbi:Metallo-dependent phosphatase-like protein [Spinellus fusiger]|nr:Metallo-dependent phosphatase-like protein [Spinellus fusiger]